MIEAHRTGQSDTVTSATQRGPAVKRGDRAVAAEGIEARSSEWDAENFAPDPGGVRLAAGACIKG